MRNFIPGTKDLREHRARYDLVPKHSEPFGAGRRERWKHPNDIWKGQNINKTESEKGEVQEGFLEEKSFDQCSDDWGCTKSVSNVY